MEIGRLIRAPRELIEGYQGLGTSTIGNVLDDLRVQGIVQNIKPVCHGFRFVGSALTVKEVTGVLGSYANEDFKLGTVIDSAQAGDVIVIDNGGQQVSTWGGLACIAAQVRGVAGLVVDGGVRDWDEIYELQFPVFSRYVVPTSAKTRVKFISMNTVVKIDNIPVRPGDIVVGDGTGIAVVHIEIARQVMETARLYDNQDRQAAEQIRKGLPFSEALRKFAKI
jgi:regulator of RNase E activity RraA